LRMALLGRRKEGVLAKGEDQKGRLDMTGLQHENRTNQLAYFIDRAKIGKKDAAEIILRKQFVEWTTHPYEKRSACLTRSGDVQRWADSSFAKARGSNAL